MSSTWAFFISGFISGLVGGFCIYDKFMSDMKFWGWGWGAGISCVYRFFAGPLRGTRDNAFFICENRFTLGVCSEKWVFVPYCSAKLNRRSANEINKLGQIVSSCSDVPEKIHAFRKSLFLSAKVKLGPM